MIGIVVVSHSAKIAEGVCDMAAQMAQGSVRLAAAGGTNDSANPIGTDAFKVLEAIESVYSEEGVLIFTDLGSAILSAETALEFLDPDRRAHVRLCEGPLIEGVIAAAVGRGSPAPALPDLSAPVIGKVVALPNRLGLHARPAAHVVRLAQRLHARITVENLSRQSGPADASSINALLGLAARQGHQLRIHAQGLHASQALAELAAFLESGCGDTDDAADTHDSVPPVQGALTGIPASAGIAVGPLMRLHPAPVEVTGRQVDNPEEEWQRLLHAIHHAREETRALFDWTAAHVGLRQAAIFDAQLLFLEDSSLIEAARRIIFEVHSAADLAWHTASQKWNARPDDVADINARILRGLAGAEGSFLGLREPAIVTARDIAPSTVKDLNPDLVLGLALETGSANAHSVILARARGIPVVVGIGPALAEIAEGTLLGLDGSRGVAWVSPGQDQVRALESRREEWLASRREALADRHSPSMTRDGRRIRVVANINSIADASRAVEYGAEGVGVLRTEFLFLSRPSPPPEDEQLASYRAIADALVSRPLVIRILDIGGDKRVPYIDIPHDANPFLGWRGIRLMLSRRDLLRTQLRAILRTGAFRSVELLLPMVSSLSELLDAKAFVAEVQDRLKRESVPYQQDIRIGVMIEVPAAVAIADQLAAASDFFSIGTNDLIQYVMAADRTNSRTAPLADPLQPAVLRMIGDAARAAHHAGIGVTLCGEMAADPVATPLLLGLGIEEFSVSGPLIPEVKRAIARSRLSDAEALAREALALDSSEAVRRLLDRSLPPAERRNDCLLL